MKRIILVDMDNVIADQRSGFYALLEKEMPELERPDLETLIHFDIEQSFPTEYHAFIKSLRLREGFFRSLPLVSGAKEGLPRLLEKYDVRIVTAPTWEWKFCVPEKFAWIEEYFGREWCGRMIISRDKTFVNGDILIDDAPEVTGALKPTWEHVLFDQPHNRTIQNKRRVTWETVDSL